jgi:hypothetical protein
MPKSLSDDRVPLQDGARECGLTGHGLLKLLKRINGAIRHDGRWYVMRETLASIKAARRALGIERAPRVRKNSAIDAEAAA